MFDKAPAGRLDKRIYNKIEDGDVQVSLDPVIGRNIKFEPRPYQVEAFTALDYYIKNPKLRAKPTQLLFHMATGSGKTLIMAGAILYLYDLGYRNFLFFVNSETIIRKTKANFMDEQDPKYLFNENINIKGKEIKVNEVANFEKSNDDINILFSTIQGLHTRLNNPTEESITFNDFIDDKMVLISDEAHHINTLTKKKLNKGEKQNLTSWEHSVQRILTSNVDNILLEFTATLEISHPDIASKYANKLLYDYSLVKFREDGYSKEVKTNQIDYDPIERAIVGVLINHYKQKVFSNNGLLVKPVILFKSKTTADSAKMVSDFKALISSLNIDKLNDIIKLDNELLNKALDYFNELGISKQNLIDEIKENFNEDKIISVDSKNDTEKKQLVINSLEKKDNEYRAVFAVDKLNEGWDVLNLFDIVRLYDTRDTKGNRPGKTTVQEAQLIGRGARYYPFKVEEGQEEGKRKYDKDVGNELRMCETLHYHCSHNPRYINELNQALRQLGILPNKKIERELILKDGFKRSDKYKAGFILLNKKVRNSPRTLKTYQEPDITKKHEYRLRTKRSGSTTLLDTKDVKKNKTAPNYLRTYHFNLWDDTIIKKALNKLPFYRFSNLKRYFPKITSMEDFINNESYFGGIVVDVIGIESMVKNLSRKDKLNIVVHIADKIATNIYSSFGDYRGTRSFYREPVRKIFRNKKLSFSLGGDTAETGKPTMRQDIEEKYFVDLNNSDWYVYNENYGSSEEKFLVKYFEGQMQYLNEKYQDIYLLRNERFFKLYRFSDGRATEPDFVLFLTDKFSDDEVIYQLFIEPKGDMLLMNDKWKEDFLMDIQGKAVIELYESREYKLIGMPFYNKEHKEDVFDKRLKVISKDDK